MATVDDNVDQFQIHPTYALAALLPDRDHLDRMLADLPTADTDTDTDNAGAGAVVQVMHGAEGLRILDQRGTGHGRLAWFHRLLQNWTYYEQILGLYTEGLTGGEFLAVIPCAPDDRRRTAATGGTAPLTAAPPPEPRR